MSEMNGKEAGFTKQEKLENMRRLEHEGRWREAREYKETVRQSGQSNDVAWVAMLQEYPPLLDEDDFDSTPHAAAPELTPVEEIEHRRLFRPVCGYSSRLSVVLLAL